MDEIMEEYRTGSNMLEISQRHGIDLFDVREVINDKKLRSKYELDMFRMCIKIHTAQPPEDGVARKRCVKTNCRNWAEFGREAEALCKKLGLDYYIKDSLRKEMEAQP